MQGSMPLAVRGHTEAIHRLLMLLIMLVRLLMRM